MNPFGVLGPGMSKRATVRATKPMSVIQSKPAIAINSLPDELRRSRGTVTQSGVRVNVRAGATLKWGAPVAIPLWRHHCLAPSPSAIA
jgi:hypothetical protein